MKTGKCIDNKNESGIILNVIDRFLRCVEKAEILDLDIEE